MKRGSLWLTALALAVTTAAHAQRGITPIRANVEALNQLAASSEREYKANRAQALALAKKHGWVIEKQYPNGSYISLQGLDEKGLPVYYITYNNSRAAATTKTDQLWAGGSLGLNLSGAGNKVNQKLGIWDGGSVRATHQELAGRIVQKDSPSSVSDHATHVAGTMVASGINPLAKGMAYGVKTLSAYDFNNDQAEMAAAASNLLVSNHSYGSIAGWRYNSERAGTSEDPYWEWWGDTDISSTEDYRFGYYDAAAAKWDEIAYNAPYYLIVKSVGNNRGETGPQTGQPYHHTRDKNGKFSQVSNRPANMSSNNSYDVIATYGTAKNILTVGAVAPISDGYTQPSDVQISSFSSYGPTDDGRIKPDIVGNGVAVLSTSNDGDRMYKSLSGTSMASPNVAGTLLLLQEHYSNLNNGSYMRAATLRALAIHTADEAGQHPGPDYIFGWGLLNAERAANLISNANKTHIIQENSIANSQTYTYEVVASGAGPLTVTIAWADPEAIPIAAGASALNNRTPRLVNDLDIRVTNQGNTFMPWKLDPNNPAKAATRGDNNLDNVELITVPDAVPGETYTITVSHKGTLRKAPQEYSLLISGAGGKAYCTNTSTATTGARITELILGGTKVAMPSDCATYRDYTSTTFSFEPGQTKELSLTLGTCGSDAPKATMLYIDWNGDGDFDDAEEEAAVSGIISGNGTFTAPVTAPATVKIGNKTRMRIVLQETSDTSTLSSCGTKGKGETQDYLVEFTRPQKDVGITSVLPIGSSLCASSSQAVVVRLRNYGAAAQSAIPVTVVVRKNGIAVTALTGTYNGNLEPYQERELLLESGFSTEAGTTYELVAQTDLQQDAVQDNNSKSHSFTVSGNVAPPEASAVRCGSETSYTLTGTGGEGIFWYTSATASQPVAAGHQTRLTNSQSSTLFAALNDFSATIGPKTKAFAPEGGYNQFTPDVLIKTNAPMVLESARLYIGHSGRITFTVYNNDGAPVSTKTLDVIATRTTPAPGVQPNDLNDQGKIYYLGLEIPTAGNYRIGIAYEGGATIFRNNGGVTGYPFGIPDVVTITGNTASGAGTTPESFYYYFYDLKVSALGCKSERVPVKIKGGVSLDRPSITREGTHLKSSAATGNQWFLDGTPIAGAIGQTYEPTQTGSYSTMVIQDGCLSDMSMAVVFDYKPGIRELGAELVVSPNPSTGRFRVEVETTEPQDIIFEVTDMLGNMIYTGKADKFHGQYNDFIDLTSRASGVYMLRVRHGSKTYTKKLLVQH